MSIPEDFRPLIRFINVARSVEKMSEPAAVVMRLSFINAAQEIINDGNCSESTIEWFNNFQASVRDATEDDVTAAREFADNYYEKLKAQFESGVRRKAMPMQFTVLSVLYEVFSDPEADDRSKKSRIVGAKIKKMLEQGESDGNPQPAAPEQPPQSSQQPAQQQHQPGPGGFPPGHPYYVPPQQDDAPQPPPVQPPQQPPYAPPPYEPQMPPYQPPEQPKVPPPEEPKLPPPENKPEPKPEPKPAKPNKPAASGQVTSLPGCKYDREAALAFFQQEGIQLVTKGYPMPSDDVKKPIQRYLDYSYSRLLADEYKQPYAFITNALKAWKSGKA